MAEIDDRPREAAPTDLDSPALYVNRELSLLEFQRRVLEEAADSRVPLLERVKFLAIVGSNMDEFSMIRVAGLKQQVAAGVVESGPDGMSPVEQLAAVRKAAGEVEQTARALWRDEILPALSREGIRVVPHARLDHEAKAKLRVDFEDAVFPVLTPLAVDPSRPFPHISNLSLNLAVVFQDTSAREHFARVKVPATLPQLVPVPSGSAGGHTFVLLEDLVAANLDTLFPGMEILEVHPFRVTRNADLIIQELEAGDLLESIEESVHQRQFGFVTRLTVGTDIPPRILDDLLLNLEADRTDVIRVDGPLALANLASLTSIDRADLKEPPLLPGVARALERKDTDIFGVVRNGDILLHHPFDSFGPVLDFLRAAATDPDVLAIKMTLYRVGRNSPVVKALLTAREEGKQVAVLVELKARFDEHRNIEWSRALEQAGVHVVYGFPDLKVHAKMTLIVRREGDGLRRYVHVGTGNYHAVTARSYEDLSLFTADPTIAEDIASLFNYLTGFGRPSRFQKILVAPFGLRTRLVERIRAAGEAAATGVDARIRFKVNALTDEAVIEELYTASQHGAKIEIVARSICMLKPGVPGMSDNISVRSIVGRYLEHSRLYGFQTGDEVEVFLGSADLMTRNLDHRIEVVVPVEQPRLRQEMLAIFDSALPASCEAITGRHSCARMATCCSPHRQARVASCSAAIAPSQPAPNSPRSFANSSSRSGTTFFLMPLSVTV
jgi:polyphosphate kinase